MEDDRFVSYAQNLEDVMLWRALGGVVGAGGFYVDVGAADPTALSVTRALYERGWHGVNVEPLPEVAAALRAARPRDVVVEAAVAERPGRAVFYRVGMHAQTGLSTLEGAEAERHRAAGATLEPLEVEVTTLAAVWQAHVQGAVHVLKIDAEGAEAAVLAGADFSAVRPWIIVIEATRPNSAEGTEAAWEPGLVGAGYRMVWFDGLNRFYLAEEHAALAVHFGVPPNVFDHYVQYDLMLQDRLAGLERALRSREAEVGVLQAEVARLAGMRAVEPVQDAATVESAAAGARGASPRRRVAWLAYRLVRPVVRPLAWRLRTFLVGDLAGAVAALRAHQDVTRDRLDEVADMVARQASVPPPPAPVVGLDSALGRTMEGLLLTLALEEGRDGAGPDGSAP